jgi:excisionase family DNA binding protein
MDTNTHADASPFLIPVPEAARLCGVSPRYLWERVRTGELPIVALGRRRLVRPSDLERFVEAHVTAHRP